MTQDSVVRDDTVDAAGEGTERPGKLPPDRIAPAVEAILLTLDKPVSAARLAEALGLAPPAPAADGGQPASENLTPEPKPKRRRKAAAGEHDGGGVGKIEAAIAELNRAYESTGRAFRVEAIAGGYRIMTLPEYAPVVAAFHRARASAKLSRAAVETLAIIAYKQPITRATLEAIRGVACGEVLRSLMERRLVIIKGRAEELGRPILYGTSKEFLDTFGLASLKDLPTSAELPGLA
jgi:segregation and condensation protein B